MITRNQKAFSSCRECLFLILLFLTHLAFGQLRKAPEWVHKTPVSTEAYYGIGSVNYKLYPEYRAKARKMALREIAEKIFVSINAESTLVMTYENDRVDYLLDETVSLASSNFLSGHQKVSEWIDKRSDMYYVLFKLDLEVYKAKRAMNFQSLEELVTLMQNEARVLFEQGEVARGVIKLSECIIRLDAEMNRLVEPEYKLAMQNWQLTSIYELEQEIAQIGFNLQSRYQFQPISREPLTIADFLIDKTRGIPVNGLNLSLRVLQGDIFRYSFQHNNSDALKIYGLFPENGSAAFQIEAELRLEDRVRRLLDPSIRTRFISAPVSIAFVPYTIAFDETPTANFSTQQLNEVIDFFRTITRDLGLREVTEEADYHISLQPQGDLMRQEQGYYQGTVSLNVTIYDAVSNQQVYEYALPQTEIRVNHPEGALQHALGNYVNQSDKLLVSFVTFLCASQL